ncbi:MAG: HAMP domain-containing protein [bacterium]
MSKLTSKITTPIILVGLFSIVVFVSLNYNQLELSFYVILLFLSIYIFSFGFAVGQNFASPIKKLLQKAIELSEGDLSSRVYLKTKDELSELADVFNKIAEELEESHIDSKMIERSVDVKTKARTQPLEETINALEQKVKNRTMEFEKIMGESKALQTQIKTKEAEVAQLKKEIDNLTSKVKKRKIVKPAKE